MKKRSWINILKTVAGAALIILSTIAYVSDFSSKNSPSGYSIITVTPVFILGIILLILAIKSIKKTQK